VGFFFCTIANLTDYTISYDEICGGAVAVAYFGTGINPPFERIFVKELDISMEHLETDEMKKARSLSHPHLLEVKKFVPINTIHERKPIMVDRVAYACEE